jgi:hypothetical protein
VRRDLFEEPMTNLLGSDPLAAINPELPTNPPADDISDAIGVR